KAVVHDVSRACTEGGEHSHGELGTAALALNKLLVRLGGAMTKEEKVRALSEWLAEQEGYLLKPMNCPHHIQIYTTDHRSYHHLPVRLAEFGTVSRFEQTGELSG